MKCTDSWVRDTGDEFKVQVSEISEVFTFSGRLLITDWEGPDTSPPPKYYTRAQLEQGIREPIEPGNTYNLDIVVVPRTGKTARIHTVIECASEQLVDDDCDRTAENPICAWEITRS